jgi:hypothetical protein
LLSGPTVLALAGHLAVPVPPGKADLLCQVGTIALLTAMLGRLGLAVGALGVRDLTPPCRGLALNLSRAFSLRSRVSVRCA